jgi:hypothetical protein
MAYVLLRQRDLFMKEIMSMIRNKIKENLLYFRVG